MTGSTNEPVFLGLSLAIIGPGGNVPLAWGCSVRPRLGLDVLLALATSACIVMPLSEGRRVTSAAVAPVVAGVMDTQTPALDREGAAPSCP